jgi:hypothetical protein
MQPKNNFPSKTGLGALALGAILALGAGKADALTSVVDDGTYDITSDTLFTGIVDNPMGGSGDYIVNFTSPIDPFEASAASSLTVDVLGTFTDLTMTWQKTGSGTPLASTSVGSGITSLETTFDASNPDQSLVFDWAGSAESQGFDFDVSPAAVPLPAGGWLLLTAFGGMAALRRRRKAA